MKIKLLALILSAVVVVGGGATATVISNQPEKIAIDAITGAVEDFCEREELAPLLSVFKEGSIEFAYDGIDLGKEETNAAAVSDLLSNATIKGKLYFAEDAFLLEDLQAEYEDFKISTSIFLSEETIGISENEIFDASVSLTKGEAADDFEDSIFAFGSGSDYELGEEISETIVKVLTAYDDSEISDMKKDGKKLAEHYIKNIYKIITKHAEFESESDEVKLNSGKEKARVITITIDAEAMANIIADTYEFLCDDDKLVDYLDKYEDSLAPILENADLDEDESLSDMYEQALEDAEDYIDELVESAEDYDGKEKFELIVVTPKLGSKLLKLSAKYDKETLFSFDFGKDGVKDTDEISFSGDGQKVVYEISKNTSDKAEASLTVNDDKIFTLSIDKKDEEFKLSILEDEVVIKGNITTKGKATTIEIEKVTFDSDVSFDTKITLVVNEKDKMPKSADDFDKLSDITDEDIDGWIKSIEDLIGGGAEDTPNDKAPEYPEDIEDGWTSDY